MNLSNILFVAIIGSLCLLSIIGFIFLIIALEHNNYNIVGLIFILTILVGLCAMQLIKLLPEDNITTVALLEKV